MSIKVDIDKISVGGFEVLVVCVLLFLFLLWVFPPCVKLFMLSWFPTVLVVVVLWYLFYGGFNPFLRWKR